MKEKIPTEKLATKLTLTVRALVGGYLLYTSYGLIGSFADAEPKDKVFFGVFIVLFTVIGIALLLFSAKNYKEGRYQGGAMDAGEENSDAMEENVAEVEQMGIEKTISDENDIVG